MLSSVDGSAAALSRVGSHTGRHVSFRHSSSSDAASDALASSHPAKARTSISTASPPPTLPSQHQPRQPLKRRHAKARRTGNTSAATSASAMATRNAATLHFASAAAANDPHQWILALGPPPAGSGECQTPTPPPPPAADATTEHGKAIGAEKRAGARGDEDRDTAAAGAAATVIPLEERIGLPELQLIMLAFRHASYAELAAAAAATAAATAAMSAAAAAAPGGASQGPKSAGMQKVPYFVSGDAQALMGETIRFTEDTPTSVNGGKDTLQRLIASHSSMALATTVKAETPTSAREMLLAASPDMSSSSSPSSTAATTPAAAAAAAPLRTLSRGEFTKVLQYAVPSATPLEIHALLAKAISDTQDSVSWNELSTFLVTCSRQKADLAMEDQRFVLAGRPCNLHFDEQHSESITCVAVSRQRRLIATGCSSGAVRAWSSGSDLAYRGLLLKVEGWIVGLHWGCRERVLYVVTMDRCVYVLEGTTYEVLRVFHGRGIKSTPDSVAYATETIGQVNVGGVALPKHRPANERGYAGARLRMPSAPSSASSGKGGKASNSGGSGRGRRGKVESGEDRMNRLLSSAMQVRRGVSPGAGEGAGDAALPDAAAVAAATAASSEGTEPAVPAVVAATSAAATSAAAAASPPAATLTTSYSLTTGGAAEVLHQDNTLLTGAGRGPYVVQHVEEGVLTSLVDAVSATAFEESAFQEDVLLLGTTKGDAFLFVLARQCDLTQRRVLLARHVFPQLHRGVITKLAFSHAMNALISAGEDGRVRVTSLVSGQSVRTFYAPELTEQHTSVTDFALHPQLKMLLTIGPERRALVWEWNQPSPIAILDAVNRPLCCGAFVGDQLLTVSRDRVLHVYDGKSFRLRQELPLGSAGSLTRLASANGAASAFAPASSSSAAAAAPSWTLRQLHVDQVRQRVLGFGRFPFALCVKRQVSSGCPVRYRGHHAPMLATLTSRAFGQIVTVGTDGVIMTWTPATGVNECSFLLSNFSNAAATTGAPMPPIAASMDILQRRLLTGFSGGVVVAWNVLNGQVERVLTASTACRGATAATTTAHGANTSASNGGSGGSHSTAVTTSASAAPKRGVTAVGSFLRYRTVSYLFAMGRALYVDADPASSGGGTHSGGGGGAAAAAASGPQLGEYTTTYPSAWTPQPIYGDVTQLLQISPQNVACGTTSGATLIYNVLSDSQEGAPLWVNEAMLYPQSYGAGMLGLSPGATWRHGGGGGAVGNGTPGLGATRGRSVTSRHGAPEEGTLRLGATVSNAFSGDFVRSQSPSHHGGSTAVAADDAASAASLIQRGHVTARTIRLLTLPAIHPRLLVVAQEDGTLSLWHTLRRVCIGAVNLTAVGGFGGEEDGENVEADRSRNGGTVGGGAADGLAHDDGPAGTFLFDMDEEEGRLVVFGDGEGNVHVCRLEWQELSTSTEQVAAMSLLNPLLYTYAAANTASVPTPMSPREGRRFGGGEVAESGTENKEKEPAAPTGHAIPDFNEAQRSIPVLRRLERVHVFSSGLVLTGLRVVDAASTASSIISGATASPAPPPPAPPSAAHQTPEGSRTRFPRDTTPRAAVPALDASAAASAAAPPPAQRPMVIVCTGADHYVRVFTLAGVPIGELGMDEWSVADPRTYRLMGESMGVPAVPLPCSVAGHHTWQRDPAAVVEASACYFNYLSDLYAAHYPRGAMTIGGRRMSTRYGRVSIAPGAAAMGGRRRSGVGAPFSGTATTSIITTPGERALTVDGVERQAASPGATPRGTATSPMRERRGQSVSPERRATAAAAPPGAPQHAASGTGVVALSLHPDADGVALGDGADGTYPMLPSAAAAEWTTATGATRTTEWPSWQAPPPTASDARSLSTRLHRSTRYRQTASPRSPGVVRRSCLAALLPRASTPLTRRRLSAAAATGGGGGGATLSEVATAGFTLASPKADTALTWTAPRDGEGEFSPSAVCHRERTHLHSNHHHNHSHSHHHQNSDNTVSGAPSAASVLLGTTAGSFSAADPPPPPPSGRDVLMSAFGGSRSNSVGLAALQESARCGGSASAFRCSSASTRVPRSGRSTLRRPSTAGSGDVAGDAEEADISVRNDRDAGVTSSALSPSPLAPALEVLHMADLHGSNASLTESPSHHPCAPAPQRDEPLRIPFPDFPRSLSITPASLDARPRAAFASLPPSSLDRISLFSLSDTPRRDHRSTLVSPTGPRGVSLRTPSMTPTQRETPAATDSAETETVETGAMALLARQRRRLVENSKTPAAKDQLSALAMPSLSPALGISGSGDGGCGGVTARCPSKRAVASASSTFITASGGGSVRHHVESLLERRRAQQSGGVAPEAEMRASAEGFVAFMTSQLYVAPLSQPRSPALLAKPRERSLSVPPRPRPRQHVGQTL